jgi:hypothetical protein
MRCDIAAAHRSLVLVAIFDQLLAVRRILGGRKRGNGADILLDGQDSCQVTGPNELCALNHFRCTRVTGELPESSRRRIGRYSVRRHHRRLFRPFGLPTTFLQPPPGVFEVIYPYSSPQALRSGASQALDSLVNLPPEGGSRPVTFSWLSALQSTRQKHPIPDQVVRPARPWEHSARAALVAISFVYIIGLSEKKIRILLYNLGRPEGPRETSKS